MSSHFVEVHVNGVWPWIPCTSVWEIDGKWWRVANIGKYWPSFGPSWCETRPPHCFVCVSMQTIHEEHTGRTQHCAAKLELEASMILYDRAANTKHNASIQAEHITQHCIALNTISQYNSYLSTKQHWESSQHKDVRLHAKQSSCIDMENCAHIRWHHPLLQCCWGSKLGSSQLNVLAYQLCYKTNPVCPCVIVSWARQILLSTCRGERGAQRWVLCSWRECGSAAVNEWPAWH